MHHHPGHHPYSELPDAGEMQMRMLPMHTQQQLLAAAVAAAGGSAMGMGGVHVGLSGVGPALPMQGVGLAALGMGMPGLVGGYHPGLALGQVGGMGGIGMQSISGLSSMASIGMAHQLGGLSHMQFAGHGAGDAEPAGDLHMVEPVDMSMMMGLSRYKRAVDDLLLVDVHRRRGGNGGAGGGKRHEAGDETDLSHGGAQSELGGMGDDGSLPGLLEPHHGLHAHGVLDAQPSPGDAHGGGAPLDHHVQAVAAVAEHHHEMALVQVAEEGLQGDMDGLVEMHASDTAPP
jgi:hypothetical protein